MELELGLALPNHNPMINIGLDLNSCCNNGSLDHIEKSGYDYHRNRRFLENHANSLSWSGGRQWDGRDDHGGRRPKSRRLQVNHESDNDEVQEIEGWPAHHRRHGGSTAAEQMRKSMYVKVKMEGVAIGRKVDLTHYHSYRDLTTTLIHMFAKYSTIDRNMEKYILMYQDKEGEWMLVGDAQWERFIESVQRLEILKDNRMGFRLLSSA